MKKQVQTKVRKQLFIMLAIVIGMFGFCYALVPLYNVFCQTTGLNGKTGGKIEVAKSKVDYSRSVTVELLSTLNEDFPGEFYSLDKKFTLHPGEYVKTAYFVKNGTTQNKIVQAIPSVTPGLAARHIKKVECFCFQKQPLSMEEAKEMPLVFTVDPALPTHIHTITLAYTLFDVTHQ